MVKPPGETSIFHRPSASSRHRKAAKDLVEVVDSHTGTTKVPVGKSLGGKKVMGVS